jgi:YVTN family beta-propeller protein
LQATKTITLGKDMRPMGTAVSRDGKELYVTTGRSRMLMVIDTTSHMVVGSVDVGIRPWGLALSADGKTAYTANGPSNEVAVVDLASRRVTATIAVGRGPWGAAFVAR